MELRSVIDRPHPVNDWQISGIAAFISGAPVGVSYSTTTAHDVTGTPNLAARIDVIGKVPLSKGDRTFSRNFDTSVFRLPAKGTIGTAQKPLLRCPGVNNLEHFLVQDLPDQGASAPAIPRRDV